MPRREGIPFFTKTEGEDSFSPHNRLYLKETPFILGEATDIERYQAKKTEVIRCLLSLTQSMLKQLKLLGINALP
jgi:hypothetical protein